MNQISVIIPAHNEAATIGQCLKTLFGSDEEPVVIVVANACSDATAVIAKAHGSHVKVVKTDVASKSNALNLGDSEAGDVFPRFYIDADVVLSPGALRKVARALDERGILAAAPLMNVDCTDRPWRVRAYYDVWLRLPYCRQGMIGSGVYAVSAEGRKRFGRFPDITADDAFVRLHFAPRERKTVETCSFTVKPPKSLGSIIAIKTRSHFGNEELKRLYPHLWKNEEARHGGALLKLAMNPLCWLSLVVYIYVKLVTRYRTRERFRMGKIHQWERDDTSREVTTPVTEA